MFRARALGVGGKGGMSAITEGGPAGQTTQSGPKEGVIPLSQGVDLAKIQRMIVVTLPTSLRTRLNSERGQKGQMRSGMYCSNVRRRVSREMK